MRQILAIILAVIGCGFMKSGNCQNTSDNWLDLSVKSNSLHGKIIGTRFFQKPVYKGTNFYNLKWLKGKVIMGNGDIINDLELRLNSRLDEVIYYNARVGAAIIIEKNTVKEFSMVNEDGITEFFEKVTDNKYPKEERYYRRIWEGSKSLYVWYRTKEIKITPYYDMNNILRNSEMVLFKEYYIFSPESGFQRLHTNRKAFFNYFAEQKRKIRKVFRRNGIYKLDNELMLMKAFSVLEREGILSN